MVPKVVLTGGPCAGKTTCLRAIRERYGEQIVTVPEAATLLLGSGFPPPGDQRIPCSPEEWLRSFQAAILSCQQALEESFARLAKSCPIRLLVCDRGLLDGAAYWPGGRAAFLDHFGLALDDCFARYERVLHLPSLAQSHPHLYGPEGNLIRYEGVAEALRVEEAVRAAWEGHPGRLALAGERELPEKVAWVLEQIGATLRDSFPSPLVGEG
jgi:predicted ATPase